MFLPPEKTTIIKLNNYFFKLQATYKYQYWINFTTIQKLMNTKVACKTMVFSKHKNINENLTDLHFSR